jgi:hypothetical protein
MKMVWIHHYYPPNNPPLQNKYIRMYNARPMYLQAAAAGYPSHNERDDIIPPHGRSSPGRPIWSSPILYIQSAVETA